MSARVLSCVVAAAVPGGRNRNGTTLEETRVQVSCSGEMKNRVSKLKVRCGYERHEKESMSAARDGGSYNAGGSYSARDTVNHN